MKNFVRPIIFISVMASSVFYAAPLFAQISLTGRVMTFDSVNVQNAVVVLRSVSDTTVRYSTVTDAQGRFAFLITKTEEEPQQPASIILHQNFPNPFTDITTIRYELVKSSDVRLEIFDVLGRLVKRLVSERQPAGMHVETWDGKNETGETLRSGIYFCALTSDRVKVTRKMLFEFGDGLGGMRKLESTVRTTKNFIPRASQQSLEFRKSFHAIIEPGTYSIFVQDIESSSPRIMSQYFDDVVIRSDTLITLVVNRQFEIGKWKMIGLENSKVITIATDPERENIIYAGTASDFSAGTRGKVYKTTDWGRTWTALVNDVSPTVIVIDPHNRQVIYVGLGTANFTRPGIIMSINGGLTWSRADSGIDFGVEGISVISLAIDPENSNILYSSTGGFGGDGLYKTTNAGSGWTDLRKIAIGPAAGALANTANSIAFDPLNTEVIFIGTSNNLLKSTDGGLSWNFTALRKDGVDIDFITVSKHQTGLIYFSLQHAFAKSDDGAQSYRILNKGLPVSIIRGDTSVWIGAFVEHSKIKGNIFLAAFTQPGHELYSSTDSGESWFARINSAFSRYITSLKLTSRLMYLIAGTDKGVYLFRIA